MYSSWFKLKFLLGLALIAIWAFSATHNVQRWLVKRASVRLPTSLTTSKRIDCQRNPGRCAYAALLCDDELLPALRVLLYSIRRTETLHPITILALPGVSAGAVDEIQMLGHTVLPVPQLDYPYEGLVKYEAGINKQCRYSKLHLWNLAPQYSKVVYLDVDTAVQKNIDHLFDLDFAFAGVRDIGDVINTGVLVLQPSRKIFQDMLNRYMTAPSYNRGDQGFLNWYFLNHTAWSVGYLEPAYNVPAKMKTFALGKLLIKDAFVYHFTAETKPWSFHFFYHPDWKTNYHPKMFASWREMAFNASRETESLSHEYGLPRFDTPLRRSLSEKAWANADRQYDICHKYDPRREPPGKFPVRDKYSVAISFYNEDRLAYLPRLIEHYWLSPLVDMVYITWHRPDLAVPADLKSLVKAKRLKILKQGSDSLNNRFNPIHGLNTQAVFICDDDIFIPIDNIDFSFQVWQGRPDQIVGFFPRIHGQRADGSIFYDMAGAHHKYSIILTKAMMMDAFYLHAYTCVLSPEIHRYVDLNMNCEDIAMNMMVSGLTGQAPVCVAADALDFGTSRGISISSAFTVRRDQCILELSELFGRDTLVVSREMVNPFIKNSFKKVDWSEFHRVLAIEAQAKQESLNILGDFQR